MTMKRIQQLPSSVVTKIAAGEVIERPASVAKELLENSVDAGSTRIDVEVEQGGSDCIRVVDNGCGISAGDLPLAFASHATSKLANADDLFRISTLGFRGEALASIGGVAQVLLQSRPADLACGAEITCHGGTVSPVRAWNGSPGTRMEVRHLFYNTPVRRKVVKAIATEDGDVSEACTRLALAHPALHLTLRHSGKAVYEVPAEAGLKDRLRLFFGAEVTDKLYAVEAEQPPVRLRGFLADPECERGTSRMQYVFVNGRCIRDRSLMHALQEAYRGLLMTGRYAVAFLFLDLPADELDVNVHPTKIEVRFRNSQALHHLVFSALRERLRAENLTARLRAPVLPTAQWAMTSAGTVPAIPEPTAALPFPTHPAPASASESSDFEQRPTNQSQGQAESPRANGHIPSAGSSNLPSSGVKAIQLYDAYVVLETQEGMLVIDQHALHERILFEELKRRLASGTLEVQKLLTPLPVDLSAEQAARTLEQREALAELGLGVEDFGGGTVLLTSYPAILGNRPPQAVLKSVVDHLLSKERLPSREVLLNDLLSLMACHAAVRAGDRLSAEQIAALIARRDLAHDTHHCPHGRPTAGDERDRKSTRLNSSHTVISYAVF